MANGTIRFSELLSLPWLQLDDSFDNLVVAVDAPAFNVSFLKNAAKREAQKTGEDPYEVYLEFCKEPHVMDKIVNIVLNDLQYKHAEINGNHYYVFPSSLIQKALMNVDIISFYPKQMLIIIDPDSLLSRLGENNINVV